MSKKIMINLFHGYYSMLCQEMGVEPKPTNWPIAWIAASYMILNASLEESGKEYVKKRRS